MDETAGRDAAYVAGLRRAVAIVDMWYPTGGDAQTLMLVQATLRRVKEQLNREAAAHLKATGTSVPPTTTDG